MVASIKRIQVVVGVVTHESCVLMAKRHDHQHQGGLWEFPGGKVESGETQQTALLRELQEEVGISVTGSHFIKTIHYDYPDKSVDLHFYHVTRFEGDATHQEGQLMIWQPIESLEQLDIPDANRQIINDILSLTD